MTLLTYGFAREQGVALQPGEPPVMLMREGARALSLAEAIRAAGPDGREAVVRRLESAAYDRALSDIYASAALAGDAAAGADDADSLSRLIDRRHAGG